MFSRFFKFVMAFFTGSAVNAQSDSLNILFIGNSYTHMNDMPESFEKIALNSGKKVKVLRNTHSGFSFAKHSEREDMYEAIKKEKWDFVILQGYSREFIHDYNHIDSATVPYLNKILDSIYTNSPLTNVLFYQTWGYDNGYHEKEETNSYEKMAMRIRDGYNYISNRYNLPVVPVGMTWRKAKSELKNIDLYAKDRAHPSKYGSYLIANTFYQAIFNDEPKETPIWKVKKKKAKQITKLVREFVPTVREEYHLDSTRYHIKIEDKTLKFSVDLPNIESVEWDFGDRTSSLELSGMHVYAKYGVFTVQLKIRFTNGKSVKDQRTFRIGFVHPRREED